MLFTIPPAGPSPDLADRFALILDGLCRATAARMARNPTIVPLLLLTWGRLRRMVARFAALAARASAGTLQPRPARPTPASQRPPRERTRLPQGFAWLVRLVPEAAAYGSQLQHLLTDPDIAALLAAAPQAGRILRPLCRMLAVSPGALLERPRRPKPPPARPKASGRPSRPPPCADLLPMPGLGSFRLPRILRRGGG